MDFSTDQVMTFLSTQGVDIGLRILGAIAAWIIGGWLIKLAVNGLGRLLERRFDPTLNDYIKSILSVLLKIVLILGILGMFGVQTTSFAALLAGAGLAIGTAWGGLLQHFAAGVFMQVLRPFKIGDFISAGNVTGTVRELGLFTTTIVTPDNVLTIVGNNKLFGDNIQNFSALPYRRVDAKAKIANGVDAHEAIARLRAAIAKIPNVMATPAPDVDLLDFSPEGPILAVRPYTNNEHYWQVWFDTNRAIVDTFGAAGYPVPETPIAPRTR